MILGNNLCKEIEVNRILSMAVLCLLVAGCTNDKDAASNPPDNTTVNKRDADAGTVTPMDQSNDSAEIERVAAIRKDVLDIDKLSVNGRNVKIITNAGKVVLRGPVASSSERDAIVLAAQKHADAGNVTNQLEVKTN